MLSIRRERGLAAAADEAPAGRGIKAHGGNATGGGRQSSSRWRCLEFAMMRAKMTEMLVGTDFGELGGWECLGCWGEA